MTQGKLKEALEAAQQMNNQSLQKCIDRLRETEKTYKSQGKECITEIFTDFAPLSFYFARTVDGKFSGNGGIIFHGKHDNGGDGGAPTFSVSLIPCDGWSVHT